MNNKIPALRKTIGFNPLDSIEEIDRIHSISVKNKLVEEKNKMSSVRSLGRALKDSLQFTENVNQFTSKDVEKLFDTEISLDVAVEAAALSGVKSKAAINIIQRWSAVSAAGCVLPGIVVNGIVLTSTHIMMISELCKIYEIRFENKKILASITGIVTGGGASILGNFAVFSLAKKFTSWGVLISAITEPLIGYSTTFALGYTIARHFENGGTLETLDVKYTKQQMIESRARLGRLGPKSLRAQAC